MAAVVSKSKCLGAQFKRDTQSDVTKRRSRGRTKSILRNQNATIVSTIDHPSSGEKEHRVECGSHMSEMSKEKPSLRNRVPPCPALFVRSYTIKAEPESIPFIG
jgi:hypothetical protein